MRASGLVLLTLTMVACSGSPQVVDRLGREPNARKLVSEGRLFNQADVRIAALSKPRPWKYSTFYAWRVCMKAVVPGPGGIPSPKTYALFIHGNEIADRREAVADDLCGTEAFEPLTSEPAATVADVASSPPPRAETGVFGGMFDWLKF